MNKLFLILTITLSCSYVSSQTKWGFHYGQSIFKFTTNIPDANISTFQDYNLGFFIEPQLSKHLFLETGLSYSLRGYETMEKHTDGASGDGWFYYLKYSKSLSNSIPHFGIPVIANYYIVDKKFKLFTSAGLKLGKYSNGTIYSSIENRSYEKDGNVPQHIRDLYKIARPFVREDFTVGSDGLIKSFTFDSVIGGGVGLGRFFLTYRYNLGLMNNSHIDDIKFKNIGHDICLKVDFSKR